MAWVCVCACVCCELSVSAKQGGNFLANPELQTHFKLLEEYHIVGLTANKTTKNKMFKTQLLLQTNKKCPTLSFFLSARLNMTSATTLRQLEYDQNVMFYFFPRYNPKGNKTIYAILLSCTASVQVQDLFFVKPATV